MLNIVLDATLLSGIVPCALTLSDEWPPPAPYLLPNSFTIATAHWKSVHVTNAYNAIYCMLAMINLKMQDAIMSYFAVSVGRSPESAPDGIIEIL
ncbi:hypothetical protein BDV28DRAFT_150420 [Aspergillus coremiiformis]|uniref:Uncharacterized protein n=1 Tax=Aspergillus coremiiformis TaxID=138285 RepID=A0A5N6Z1X8_9EURO|nr:hypothetical protein BDV28DRAFT_150420 [Aspergillus coremiiformis]